MITQNEFKIYDIMPEGPFHRATCQNQTAAIMSANNLALTVGRVHAVEIREGALLLGLLYFDPVGVPSTVPATDGATATGQAEREEWLAAIRDDRMAEAIAGCDQDAARNDLLALGATRLENSGESVADAFLGFYEGIREIGRGPEPVGSFVSQLKLQSCTATATIYTTRDESAARQAVVAWPGATMRRNGRPHPEKGQSWLVVVGAATIEAEWQREVA